MTQLDLDFSTASHINKEKLSGQNKQIYEHLAKGNTINVFQAIHMGIFHLHSRIAEIRNKHGIFLYDRMIKKEGEKQKTNKGGCYVGNDNLATLKNNIEGIKNKDLVGIPWMLAFALRSDGWYLRQDIIWHKPNPMPESVTDRCTKSHEYIFLLSKSQKYYYAHEDIKYEMECSEHDKRARQGRKRFPTALVNGIRGNTPDKIYEMANKRSVWTVTTKPYSDAHFATFPEDLIVDCIKAGCPENGLIIDPFMGAGTTALVSAKLNRNFIGFELNEKYIKIAERRLQKELGMFNPLRA